MRISAQLSLLQEKIGRAEKEATKRDEETHLLRQQIKDRYATLLKTTDEKETLLQTVESLKSDIAAARKDNEQISADLKANKASVLWFKTELEGTKEALRLKDQDVHVKHVETEELRKQLGELKITLLEKSHMNEGLQEEVDRRQQQAALQEQLALELHTQLDARQTLLKEREEEAGQHTQLINQLHGELGEHQRRIASLEQSMQTREQKLAEQQSILVQKDQELSSQKEGLGKSQQELDGRTMEVQGLRQELENVSSEISKMRLEAQDLQFKCRQIESQIPSSVIMVDAGNQVSAWNKKAESLLGINAQKAIGCDLFNFAFMERERLREGYARCLSDRTTVRIKAIALSSSNDDSALVDVTIHPVLGDSGELQGTMLVMEDVTGQVAVEAELQRKEMEVGELRQRLTDSFKKNAIAALEGDAGKRLRLGNDRVHPVSPVTGVRVVSPVVSQDVSHDLSRKAIAGDLGAGAWFAEGWRCSDAGG